MIFKLCVNCTRSLPRIVTPNHPGVRARQLCTRTPRARWNHERVSAIVSGQRGRVPCHTYLTPHLTLRFYNTDKPTGGAHTSSDLPIHLVNPSIDLTKPAQHSAASEKDGQEKEVDGEERKPETVQAAEVKREEVAAETVQAPVEGKVEEVKTTAQQVVPVTDVQLGLAVRSWNAVKKMALHYYDGSRLLVVEVRISSRLCMKIMRGDALTRRERSQLKRTVGDLFRVVPFAIFILIPFMEVFLPLALWLFPGMMPSTFETIDKKKEKKLKTLKLRLDLAKFVQNSMVEGITLQTGQPVELEKFSQFIARTRSKDPRDDIDELVSFSKLFSEDLTLDNLPRQYVVAMCKLLDQDTGFHTESFLRFRLRSRMRSIKEDDQVIREEGLENMTASELQHANADRGMRSVGVSIERLRNQLDQWLILSLEKDIPMTLLLLSRVMMLPAGSDSVTYEDLRNAVAHLPDSLIGEARITLAKQAGEKIDNRARLEAVRLQEQMIKKEQDQQQRKDELESEKERVKEELQAKEVSNTRVAANLQMRKETLKDMAKPILTEDQIDIRRQEVTEIQSLISGLRDKKNPLLEEKEELRDLIEKALVHHMTIEDGSLKASTGSKLLSNKVAKMLNHSHKVLTQLESALTKEEFFKLADTDGDGYLSKQEIKNAINEILNVNKKEKLLAILEVIPEQEHKDYNTSEVLKGLEKIAKEGTDLTGREISAIMRVMKEEKTLPSKSPKNEDD